MDENPAEISTITVNFGEDNDIRARMTASGSETYDKDWVWAAGFDGIARCCRGQRRELACGTAEWRDDQTFEMTIDTLGLYRVFRITTTFSNGGNRAALTVEDLDRFDPEPTWTMAFTVEK